MSNKKDSLLIRLGVYISIRPFLYLLLNLTWGLITTLIGIFVLVVLLPFGKVRRLGYHLYFEFNKDKDYGFSIGMISFIGKVHDYKDMVILYHEFGHGIQNAIFGPFTLFIVYIPSLVRYHYREWRYNRGKTNKGYYDDIWFENSATEIGNKWYENYVVNIKFKTIKKQIGRKK